jgi:hypothetical protein
LWCLSHFTLLCLCVLILNPYLPPLRKYMIVLCVHLVTTYNVVGKYNNNYIDIEEKTWEINIQPWKHPDI